MRTTRRLRPPPASRSPAAPKREMHPSRFAVNQYWLIVKSSKAPIQIDEGLFDVYVLQDAASMYLFGSVFTPSGTGNASEGEINSLFQGAWRVKHEWPQCLLLPDSIPSSSSFVIAAKANRIPIEVVPESTLAIYINDVQTAFRERFGGDETSAA